MCGIVGLQLRGPELQPRFGKLLTGMLSQLVERGPDSAGISVYGDPRLSPPGHVSVSALGAELSEGELTAAVRKILPDSADVTVRQAAETSIVQAAVSPEELIRAVRAAAPAATVTGAGSELAVFKGVGRPDGLAATVELPEVHGWQGLAHTRLATESAVTSQHCHPFSVGTDQCLVHNGSFANHATIRRELQAEGVEFDSDNDSEVGARFVATRLAEGNDLETSLRLLCERFDGFYTLLVTTAEGMAVVRDAIACKPAIVAETTEWVAMASEFRALADLPGIEHARIFEPEPERVYTWQR